MALSTSLSVVTRSGLSSHHDYLLKDVLSVGVATFSNFKTGSSNLHSAGVEVAGVNVLGGDTPIGAGATIYNDGGARFSGVATATSFSGSGANLTSLPSAQLTGALPALDGSALIGVASTDNIKTSTTANFTGGIQVGGSTTLTGALSATTATASVVVVGSAVTSNSQGIDVTGVVTATTVKVGSAISFTDGAVSATRFHGDGSNLTGIDASSIKNGNDVKIQANASGATVTGVITAVGGNPNEGAFLKGTAVGVGTTTLAGRNAGVGTAPGTIIFNATSGILQVYVNDLDTWQNVSSAEGYSFQATGGTKSTTSRSGYAVHTFTAPGTFTVLSNTVTGGEYLIVAGGGGGGKGSLPGVGNEVGAGGAGGHRSFSGQTFTPGSYTVVVGSGGPGSGTGGDGGTSSVFGNSSTGGGSGAGHNYGGTNGRPGGSGGGGAHPHTSGGSGTGGQGNPGGNGGHSTGGGGGGAGGGGSTGQYQTAAGGNGGSGTSNSITGSSVTRAGGGGGGHHLYGHHPSGGSGGGGDGGSTAMTPNAGGTTGYGDPGTANTGGGGGGNGVYQGLGGNGGSGVVIIAYPTS